MGKHQMDIPAAGPRASFIRRRDSRWKYFAGLEGSGRLLELGCGTGANLREVAALARHGQDAELLAAEAGVRDRKAILKWNS